MQIITELTHISELVAKHQQVEIPQIFYHHHHHSMGGVAIIYIYFNTENKTQWGAC